MIPINALPMLEMQARRFMSGSRAQPARDGWKLVTPVSIQTCRVATIEPQTTAHSLVLLVDEGLETELQLSLPSPEFAQQLGEALIQEAATHHGQSRPS